MMILVDSSVWMQYFSAKSKNPLNHLDHLILERQVATCSPIYAEVLSGQMNKEVRGIMSHAFQSMPFCDPDWNQHANWELLGTLTQHAYQNNIPACGLVDRMIALSAQHSRTSLWTLDQKLSQLARSLKIPLFEE